MDLVNEQLSPEAAVKVVVKGGKVGLAGVLDTKGVDVHVDVMVEVDYFIDALAEKIPGQVDDAVLAILKQALKAL